MRKIRLLLYTFVCVTTCVDFATAIYVSIFWPQQAALGCNILWQILSVSFLCSLPVLIYPEKELSRKKTNLLIFIHYVEVNIVVLGCGLWFEWFYVNDLAMVIGMLVLIAVIFWLVSTIVWLREKHMAGLMNERLKEYQEKKQENA